MKNVDWYKIVKVIIAVIALIMFYFYLQNDRYYVGNQGFIVDKWKNETFSVRDWIKK